MAGFVPGLLPTNHSQEKEFAQAYEDVLERYKGNKTTRREDVCTCEWSSFETRAGVTQYTWGCFIVYTF